MIFEEWEEVRLQDVILFNPPEKIKKGTTSKKIGMEKLNSFQRKIEGFELTEYKSGTKFRNGDTLLARITPCLENGKTAQVTILDDNEVGFGSTEFIVMREIEGVTDKDFIYYLSISPNIRDIAIKSMTGTSGRQRAQIDVIKNSKVFLPPLHEQKVIANTLLSLDKKIEVNNEINNRLEETARAIFKQWFIDFEFPNNSGEPYKSSGGKMVESELGMIPNDWEITTFRSLTNNVLGGDWGKENSQGNYNKAVYCLRGADIPEVSEGRKGSLPKRYILEKNYLNKKLENGDLVVEISGGSPTQSTGRITYINDLLLSKYEEDFVCTNFCRAITLKDPIYMYFFYFYWKMLYDLNVFFQFENGTTGIKNLDINSFLDRYHIVFPSKDLIKRFDELVRPLINSIQMNGNENLKLTKTRDTLIPKLVTGAIRVPIKN